MGKRQVWLLSLEFVFKMNMWGCRGALYLETDKIVELKSFMTACTVIKILGSQFSFVLAVGLLYSSSCSH